MYASVGRSIVFRLSSYVRCCRHDTILVALCCTFSTASISITSCVSDITSSATIHYLRRLFHDLGIPVRLRTNGDPLFASRQFADFLERWGVCHDILTPYYPQLYGHVESAEKSMVALHPAQVLYGHPLRSCVSAHTNAFEDQWQARAKNCDCRAATHRRDATARYDAQAKHLTPLPLESVARIQDPTTKR